MSRALATDTIVAIATPPGRGALAIVRVSGPRAIEIGSVLVAPWPEQPRHATLARIVDAAGDAIDQGIVVWYKAPHSFTGEDAVEVTCHGGALAPALVASAFVASGARPALRGEFTRRAVVCGRLDVLQAEAVGDLIEADTRAAQRVALSQLDGGLSRRVASLRERVLQLEALVAYDIDFPEEDDGPVPRGRIESASDDLAHDLQALLATAPIGELAREGAVVVIAGAPNVGKSSLFNALLGRRRAIVTEVPGTTRDAIEAVTEADGWPIRLVDTAGIRESADVVERIGIQVSRDYVGRADVVLVCGDDTASLAAAQRAVAALSDAPVVLARTKADRANASDNAAHGGKRVLVSAETGDGLRELLGAIASALQESKGRLELDAPVITRERHRAALAQALEEVHGFRGTLSDPAIPPVIAAVHLREATRCLDELIGGVDVEDVLDRVFSSFCVGK